MGYVKFTVFGNMLTIEASRNFQQPSKLHEFLKKEMLNTMINIGDWTSITVDLDSGEYFTRLKSRTMSKRESSEYLQRKGYNKIQDEMGDYLEKKIMVSSVKRNNRNYSKKSKS
tara:strand:- start:1507 stop:1848 length:342 start_codon:yes stop_codon:yes gene_type:complete